MSSTTSASTSLSEFVRARMSGQIPVFGGNPRTGMRELGSAMNTSATASVYNTIDTLAQQLKQMSLSMAPTTRASRIEMLDDQAFAAAATLDDNRVEMLLAASQIEPTDLQKYLALLRVARNGLHKKRAAQDLQDVRRRARIQYGTCVPFTDVPVSDNGELAYKLANLMGIPYDTGQEISPHMSSMLYGAVTHESTTEGREVNRVLAYIGDIAMKLMVAQHAIEHLVPVSDVNNIVQSQQTNVELRRVAMRIGLQNHVLVGANVDATSKSVIATAFEALVGVAYLTGQEAAVKAVNEKVQFFQLDTTPTMPQAATMGGSLELTEEQIARMSKEELVLHYTRVGKLKVQAS